MTESKASPSSARRRAFQATKRRAGKNAHSRSKRGTLATLPELARGYTRTALVLVGGFMGDEYLKSRLYAPDYSHCYREARK